jgi:hypothetical protein
MNTYLIAVYTHVSAGTLALITFWIAGLITKGTPRHRRVGQIYLLAMLAVIVSGVPLVFNLLERGQQIGALFLTYLLLLVTSACWSAWRAIRDRRDRATFYGAMYWFMAAVVSLAGLAIIALGVQVSAPLLMVFGGVGVIGGIDAVQSWRKAPGNPKWWLREHYAAMIGNGVATHIAFFSIGLRNAFPGVDPVIVQNLAWFVPLAGSVVAAIWLRRKYGNAKAKPPAVVARALAEA